ncbi:MAG: UDP-N-acetylglucosamine 2-epimerase (non-hydrolyzing) [Candidatus Omnitrophica bacterium CG07_land_8_20_14_0_80_42_15]|uniref:UDP-N-acetylglucosamine 2-epimerase (Non-hydrolyzing) n=1 Tax=Candidatus Aquitaenariimonas noxiae TaxID=1974741 RepID=A0A2J0KY53_9BACT|nr:MAG: UDP-N-acetylglucosamine 2-epimerase (non-hydrolyzing) [Candidatus Omnitrophica bacterium CG07_land_8_20_14_0_80_42_15]
MKKIKVINVVGCRPNFIKILPIMNEMNKHQEQFKQILVHTGQHYDGAMSKTLFEDIYLPQPDVYLGIGSGAHAEQTAKIMIEFEKVCIDKKPDLVLVVGDVNSTLACSLTAAKLCIPIAHVEAGLRSFDRSMPEEINRIVTDSLSSFLFTTCRDADKNLKREGISGKKIYFVGNIMIDTLIKFKAKAAANTWKKMKNIDYVLLTLHRPNNVDDKHALENILEALHEISKRMPIIFPAHPRTQKQIKVFGYEKYFRPFDLKQINFINSKNLINLTNPLPYLEFLNLMINAKFVLTDSGGVQEETTFLGISCLTIRESTERPITVAEGTNILVGTDKERIINESLKIISGRGKMGKVPKFWDGKTAKRIVNIFKKTL